MVLYTKAGAITKTFALSIESDDLSLPSIPYMLLTGGAEIQGRTWVFDQYNSGHFGVGAADMTSPNGGQLVPTTNWNVRFTPRSLP